MNQAFEVIASKNLGEDVSYVELGWHISRCTNTLVSKYAYPILTSVNVLELGLDNGVISYLACVFSVYSKMNSTLHATPPYP